MNETNVSMKHFGLGLIFFVAIILFLVIMPVIASLAWNQTVDDAWHTLRQNGYSAIADQDGNLDVNGDLDVDGDITAGGAYYGDGSHLTGIDTGGSSVYVDGVLTNTPNFSDGGDINFSATGSTVTATLKSGIDGSFVNLTSASTTVTSLLTIPVTTSYTENSSQGSVSYNSQSHMTMVGNGSSQTPLYPFTNDYIAHYIMTAKSAESAYSLYKLTYPEDTIVLDWASARHPHGMVLYDSKLYIGCWYGTNSLAVIPTDFSSVTYYDIDIGSGKLIWDMIIADGSLWVGSTDKLTEVSLTDPTSYTPYAAWTGDMDAIVTKGNYLYCFGRYRARTFDLTTRSWDADAKVLGGDYHSALLESTSSTIFACDNVNLTCATFSLDLVQTGTITVGYTMSDNIDADASGGLYLPLETSSSPMIAYIDMTNPTTATITYTDNDIAAIGDSLYYQPSGFSVFQFIMGARNQTCYVGTALNGVIAPTWHHYNVIVPPGFQTNSLSDSELAVEEIASDGTYCYIAIAAGNDATRVPSYVIKVPVSVMSSD